MKDRVQNRTAIHFPTSLSLLHIDHGDEQPLSDQSSLGWDDTLFNYIQDSQAPQHLIASILIS